MPARSGLSVFALLLCAAIPLGAQSAVTNRSPVPQVVSSAIAPSVAAEPATAARPAVGPTSERAMAGMRPPLPPPRRAPRPADTTRNRSLMIVGGVALVVGALIGDKAGTIIMVGGAGAMMLAHAN